MRRVSHIAVLLGSVVALAGCATFAGLDAMKECADCFDGGSSAPEDGSLGGDGGEAGTGDALPDVSGSDGALESGSVDASQDTADETSGRLDATPDTLTDALLDVAQLDAGSDVTEAGGTCTPQTCLGGCCQGNNCVAGTGDTACGQTGGACQNCSSLGDTCVAGACQAPSSNCPTTCSGCCDTNNACHASASAQFCPTSSGGTFKAGLPCEDCTAQSYPFCILDVVAWICSPIP